MQGIAAAAGVTKPVLYQHFESKEDLYSATVSLAAARLSEVSEKALLSATGPKEKVTFGLGAIIDTFADDPDMFRVLFEAPPDVRPTVVEAQAAMASGIAEHLDGLADGDETLALLLGHAILGMAENALRFWFRVGADLDVADVKSQLVELAWVGLRGRRPA